MNQILEQMLGPDFASMFGEDYSEALVALRANIIDGQNKVAIVAATVVIGSSYAGPFPDPQEKYEQRMQNM